MKVRWVFFRIFQPIYKCGLQTRIREFVSSNVRQRECCLCVPDEQDCNLCQCGIDLLRHHVVPQQSKSDKWTPDTCTVPAECDSFGEIEFNGFHFGKLSRLQKRTAPYVRVEHTTSAETLWRLCTTAWNLQPPPLLISVTGGARSFYLSERFKTDLKRGIVNAAYTTDAWIITGGTSGVMQLVGEAIEEHAFHSRLAFEQRPIVALGIATWGIVDNREALVGPRQLGLFPALYNYTDCRDSSAAILDANHTHFILVDDGSVGKFGVEIELRAKMEKYVSEYNLNDGLKTPVVLLVVEGGPNTLEQARCAIAETVPIVVIAGSGRASDVLTRAYRLSKSRKGDVSLFPPTFANDLRSLIIARFDIDISTAKAEEEISKIVQMCREILQKRDLVTIVELTDRDQQLDKAILNAFTKCNKYSLQQQLRLALLWNRADIARQLVSHVGNRAQLQNASEISEIMHQALLANAAEFLSILLDAGCKTTSNVSVPALCSLYSESLANRQQPQCFVIKYLFLKMKPSKTKSLFTCHTQVSDDDHSDILFHIGEVIQYLLEYDVDNFYAPFYTRDAEKLQPSLSSFDCPEKELFLWSILLGHEELMDMFWKTVVDPIGAAVLASRLLSALADQAEGHEEAELAGKLRKQASVFEDRAISVLTECCRRNPQLSAHLLTRSCTIWGGSSVLTMAFRGRLMRFVGSSAAQTRLTQIWLGEMSEYTSNWRIGLAAFCPLFLPLIRFKHHERSGRHRLRNPKIAAEIAKSEYKKTAFYDRAELRPVKAFRYFYRSPAAKYLLSAGFHLIFLGLFTCLVMAPLSKLGELTTFNAVEMIIWVWGISYMPDEILQIAQDNARTVSYKLYWYASVFWNRLDIMLTLLLITSIGLRAAYCMSLMFWYLRFLSYFFLSRKIGPKIYMIYRMLSDLFFFICILILFILSFGVTIQALLHPTGAFSGRMFAEALYIAYFNIFGELFLDRLNTNTTIACDSDDDIPCARHGWFAMLVFSVYIMLTNVLLLNLLIAMFTYTFQNIQDNSEQVWRFYRYELVLEAYQKPLLPAPFGIISHILWLLTCKCKNNSDEFCQIWPIEVDAQLSMLERICLEQFTTRSETEQQNALDQGQRNYTNIKNAIEDIRTEIAELRRRIKIKTA